MELLVVTRVVILFMFFLNIFIPFGLGIEMLSSNVQMSVNETLVSSNQIFELGFFSLGNSSKRYLGMWYKKIPVRRFLWVANREAPLSVTDSSASLEIADDGNLKLMNGRKVTVWSTNITTVSNTSEAVLLDTGNLVLRDSISGGSLWESFNFLADTLLPSSTMGSNIKTGERHGLSSWTAEDDPSPGTFFCGISAERPTQTFVWNGSKPYWRSGQWNETGFIGIPEWSGSYLDGFGLTYDPHLGTQYLAFNWHNTSRIEFYFLSSEGQLTILEWLSVEKKYSVQWVSIKSSCDIYGFCGQFGVCNKMESPICKCLKGFVPKSTEEWNKGNWTAGCVRRTDLLCGRKIANSTSGKHKDDGFFKMSKMKLPDLSEFLFGLGDDAECMITCKKNCSCLAYAFVIGMGCEIWTKDLIDMQEFAFGGQDLFLRLPSSELGKKHIKEIVVGVIASCGIITFVIFIFCLFRRRAIRKGKEKEVQAALDDNLLGNVKGNMNDQDFFMFDFKDILTATSNFSLENKLGEGGFGPVYKGVLQNGQEVAIKRLSKCSNQGMKEFRNEIMLISKLQHRNLVKLLGCCVDGAEKLLIYEYMHNKSLDMFLFDSEKKLLLDWAKRFNIILGIAKGLLYLHRDSCLRVIHRDLKVSNILLDGNINPKIADFGLARTFHTTQDMENTHRIAGTLGYMSPEYAMRGIFSEKSDIFSFGILLLEIVTGKKNSSSDYNEEHLNLLGFAWQLWNKGRILDMIDPAFAVSYSLSEVKRCIHVGLLCVQDDPSDRPAMPAVVQMLTTEIECPRPKEPSFTFGIPWDDDPRSGSIQTENELTLSVTSGR